MLKLDTSRSFNGDFPAYTENGQSIPCRFAPAELENGTLYPLTAPFMCREFFGDLLGWREAPETFSHDIIYRFKRFEKMPRKMVLALYLKGEMDPKKCLGRLNEIEIAAGLTPTKLEISGVAKLPTYTSRPEKFQVVAVLGDDRWQQNSILLSYYTYMLREMCGKCPLPETLGKLSPEMDPVAVVLTGLEIKTPFLDGYLQFAGQNPTALHETHGIRTALVHPHSIFKAFRDRINYYCKLLQRA